MIVVEKEERLFQLKVFLFVVDDHQGYFDEVYRKLEYECKLESVCAESLLGNTYLHNLQTDLDAQAAAYVESLSKSFEERLKLYRTFISHFIQAIEAELAQVRSSHYSVHQPGKY